MQVYSNELYHYGVVGMKWGVRRYQNPDGSLTAKGKKKYGTEEHYNAKKEYKSAYKQYSKDFNKAVNYGPIHITKKGRDKYNALWDKEAESQNKAADALNKYKDAKNAAKNLKKEQKVADKKLLKEMREYRSKLNNKYQDDDYLNRQAEKELKKKYGDYNKRTTNSGQYARIDEDRIAAYSRAEQRGYDRVDSLLMKKYGSDSMSKLQKSDNRRAAAAMAIMLGSIGAISLAELKMAKI